MAAGLLVGMIVIADGTIAGNHLLVASGIAVIVGRLLLTALAGRSVGVREGEVEVTTAGITQRLALSRVVSAERRGYSLVLRTADGKTLSVPLRGGLADEELLAQLRDGAAGVVIPDGPAAARRQYGRVAAVVGCVVAGFVAFGIEHQVVSANLSPKRRAPKAVPVTAELFAARDGTFTNPFVNLPACATYVVPLDVDSVTGSEFLASELHVDARCVAHPFRLSPAVLDQDRHQLDTQTVMAQLRAAYFRVRDATPVHLIGLTEFDLFSPAAAGETFLTIDAAYYPGETIGVGSTAHGSRLTDFEGLARALR